MQTEFDVIVVGAGPAGSAASISLARKGVRVLLLEKAKVPGEHNVSGGVLYGDFPGEWGLASLVPGFETSAPLERQIISHEIVLLGAPDYQRGNVRYFKVSKTSLATKLGLFSLNIETGHDYSVLRVPFDRWFAERALQAGAILSTGTTARELIIENGAVVGVRTATGDIRAKLVIDSSGVSSTLVEQSGLRGRLSPRQLYHAVKRVYKLDEESIDRKFKVSAGKGRAVFYLGEFMHGIRGGAFVYTNKDTLSVGVVVPMDSLIRATTEHFDRVGKLADVQDEFESHPLVADLLDGARPVEYSSHNIPKGYRSMLKQPYSDGFLVAGDALGSFVKIGSMVDGMRGAVASGMMAARAYLEASSSGSFRARNLSRYRNLLSPIYADVSRSGRDSFVSESSFTYHTLPRIVLSTRLLAATHAFQPGAGGSSPKNSTEKLQGRTGLLAYDADAAESQIKVETELASKSLTKPWVPACPADCFAVLTPKGAFSSFKDLYELNLGALADREGAMERSRGKAFSQTLEDIASGKVGFDHLTCVGCGTCGAIGQADMVKFGHEKEGHGVRYKFG